MTCKMLESSGIEVDARESRRGHRSKKEIATVDANGLRSMYGCYAKLDAMSLLEKE